MSDSTKGAKPQVKSSTKLFFSGVLILTINNLIVKAIGLLFKIPMNHIIGDEGMGYYGSAYTIYTLFYMVSTAGLPVAVSILISKSRAQGRIKQVKKIFKTALLLFVAIGLAGMLVMIFGSSVFSSAIGAEPTKYCIIAVAPTLFFICITSALRGYFQGYQHMFPTAMSQLIEALCKLGVGIVFALWAIRAGYPIYYVAAFAALGLTIGAALGMVFLTFTKLLFREREYDAEYLTDGEDLTVTSSAKILKSLAVIAIPITLSASVMSLTNLIDTAIVQNLLQQTGLSQRAATEIYGNYTSLAVPMFNLPPVLIYPIGYSIVPMISAAIGRGDRGRANIVMQSSIKVAVLVGMPCALGMSALAKPILSLFYKAESVEMAYPLLTLLAPSAFFVCLLAVTNAILQSNGYERKPLISMLTGGAVKIVTNYFLIQVIGMKATPISTFLCYLTVTVLNFYFVAKYVGVRPKIVPTFVKPLIAGGICAAAAIGVFQLTCVFMPQRLATLFAIACAGIVYALLVFLIRAITPDDIKILPKGEKIHSLLAKAHLMK